MASTNNGLPENLESMKNKELQALLKLRNLPISGKKSELIARLREYSGRKKPSKAWQYSQAKKDLKKALLDPRSPLHGMTAEAVHNSDEKYKQYPLFPEYFEEMKKKVAAEKESVEVDELASRLHRFHFERPPVDENGRTRWDGHPAQRLLEVDVARGLHKTMPPRELRMTRPEYQQFTEPIFAKAVNKEKLKQLGATFWADSRSKNGMKKYLADVAARANL